MPGLHGFEVKASRADWLNELSQPDKAVPGASRCHYWWLVTVPGVVRQGELPPGWGLFVERPGGLEMAVAAERREPQHPDWDLVEALLFVLDRHMDRQARDIYRLGFRAGVAQGYESGFNWARVQFEPRRAPGLPALAERANRGLWWKRLVWRLQGVAGRLFRRHRRLATPVPWVDENGVPRRGSRLERLAAQGQQTERKLDWRDCPPGMSRLERMNWIAEQEQARRDAGRLAAASASENTPLPPPPPSL